MADCFFHTGRPAMTRCKQCGKPLCSDCRQVTTEGIFCGEKCAGMGKLHANRLQEIEEQKASRSGGGATAVMKVVRIVVILAVLFVIFKIVMKFVR